MPFKAYKIHGHSFCSSNISFKIALAATQENWEIQKANSFKLEQICNGKKPYGLVFKSIKRLRQLLQGHPRKKVFEQMITIG